MINVARVLTDDDDSIDSQLSCLIFGTVCPEFRPTRSESDAWKLVSWILEHNIRLSHQELNPHALCRKVLDFQATCRAQSSLRHQKSSIN